MQTSRLPGACRAIQSAARASPAGLVGNCPFDSIAPVAAATTARLWVAACVSTPITYSNSCATTAIGSSLLRSPTRSVPVLGKTFRGGSLRSHAHPLRAGRTSFYQAIATDGSAPTPRRGQVRRKTQEVLVRKLKSHAPRGRSQPASRPQASQKPLEKTEHLWSVVAVFGEEFAAGAGAVGLAGQGQDFGVVDEAVDYRGGDDFVAEDLAPAPEGQVRGDHDRALFVAGGHELEEQVRRVVVEGDVADLVDLCRRRHRSTYADLGIMPTRRHDDVRLPW